MADKGVVFAELVHLAAAKGMIVRFALLQMYDARLKGNRIAIRQELPAIEEFNYNLAHELAHVYLHFDKGNTINSREHRKYEEQADRAARMLLDALEQKEEYAYEIGLLHCEAKNSGGHGGEKDG